MRWLVITAALDDGMRETGPAGADGTPVWGRNVVPGPGILDRQGRAPIFGLQIACNRLI